MIKNFLINKLFCNIFNLQAFFFLFFNECNLAIVYFKLNKQTNNQTRHCLKQRDLINKRSTCLKNKLQ